jgi:hypothetical protein
MPELLILRSPSRHSHAATLDSPATAFYSIDKWGFPINFDKIPVDSRKRATFCLLFAK